MASKWHMWHKQMWIRSPHGIPEIQDPHAVTDRRDVKDARQDQSEQVFRGIQEKCRWPLINPRLVIPKNAVYHCLSVYHRFLDCNPVTGRESMGVWATKGQWTSSHGALSRAELQWAQQRSNGKGTRWQSSKPRDDLEFDLKWTPSSSARWFWNCLWGQYRSVALHSECLHFLYCFAVGPQVFDELRTGDVAVPPLAGWSKDLCFFWCLEDV